ncbi:MAG: hypothetical protein JXR25_08565 [Pontiellaceae bacterium]|nr:hypothetical protein [Pontiellaceae bacterium]MBN2784867.1 hypothetical protein [Pontiellaceae bacterium]
MKKQIPAILLAVVCAILAIAYVDARNTIREFQQGESGTTKPCCATTDMTDETSTTNTDRPTSEDGEIVAMQDAVDSISAQADDGRRMMENIAKMMENPTMNKVLEASQRGSVGALYADMIEYLDLNPEETKYFMDLLMFRQMKQVDMAMKVMSGQLSDEDKAAMQKDIDAAQVTFKEEMAKFLNSTEDYAEFEYYEKTMGERMMLSQMDQDLGGSGAELSDDTYRELLGIMHDERESFDFTSDLTNQQNTDLSPERFSRQNLQNFANDMHQLNTAICEKAQPILSTEQYEAFVSSLKSFTEVQISQLEMAASMFGGE